MGIVSQNISAVQNKISGAAKRSLRDINTIKLIAVTKTVDVEKIKEAIDHGITIFGENRIQEAKEKMELLKNFSKIEWHMIGHLQTNKVRHTNNFNLIHSVDSLRLAEEINRFGEASKKQVNILVQVNIAREKTKFGVDTENLENFLGQLRNLKNIFVKGLMNIPPFFSNPEDSRPFFRSLRLLKDELNLRIKELGLTELSMGMSHDYEIAIEEGATMVRIGSAIFGSRHYA